MLAIKAYMGKSKMISVKKECIPVGCVPPALYRTGGGGLCQGDPLLPVNNMTDRCKNITSPQTSLAGGKKYLQWE